MSTASSSETARAKARRDVEKFAATDTFDNLAQQSLLSTLKDHDLSSPLSS